MAGDVLGIGREHAGTAGNRQGQLGIGREHAGTAGKRQGMDRKNWERRE